MSAKVRQRTTAAKAVARPEGARTVGRVLRALELLAGQSEPARLTEIAQALDVPTSSAHALLHQLIRHDYARVVLPERRYAPGSGLALLGSRIHAGLRIVEVARPVLREIAASTGENVYLGIRHSKGIAYADAVEAESGVMARFPMGSLRPLHATSPGKVFLAFHVPRDRIDEVLGKGPLPAYTKHTTTDRAALVRELDQTRARGYALNEEEAVDGAFGISTPIFGADRSLAGSLTIGVPGQRYRSRRDAIVRQALASAVAISRGLGQSDWDGIVRSFTKPDSPR